jgi:multicomponent Na+:H+ antiporter subunit E
LTGHPAPATLSLQAKPARQVGVDVRSISVRSVGGVSANGLFGDVGAVGRPRDRLHHEAEDAVSFPVTAFVTAFVQRLVVFALLWWILTGVGHEAALFGAPFVVFAALLGTLMRFRARPGSAPLWPARPLALMRLIGFFLWHSLRGGVDVTIRAFRRPLPLKPDLIDYPLRLPPGQAPILMASMVSLMPGTLAVVGAGRLRVHVLDRTNRWHRDLERLERRICAVYGISDLGVRAAAGRAGQDDAAIDQRAE